MKKSLIALFLLTNLFASAQHISRAKGERFVFGVQGDSHPERKGKMFSPELYRINMANVAKGNPDFYFLLGDDSNIDRFVLREEISQEEIDRVYQYQRSFTDLLPCPVYPVVGNHEQIAKYLLDGKPDNAAVLSARAMMKYFPVPDAFSGNTEFIEHVGVLKDYYAFETGDALFVVIDPYWHSDTPVDNIPGDKSQKNKEPKRESKDQQRQDATIAKNDRQKVDKINKDDRSDRNGTNRTKNSWSSTLGNAQYEWLKHTLEQSTAKYKFVFAHHVNGSGRGGIECASLFEWGGYGRNGKWEFSEKRPGWELPVHQLMVKHGVTIFFQGHDHLFCKQELDGIIYQSVPIPADDTYTAFNAHAYLSGDVLPNSGFLQVTVSPQEVIVDYIKAFLPGEGQNGLTGYTYTIKK